MIIKDDSCMPFVIEKMSADKRVIREYLTTDRCNMFGDNDEYFLCVAYEVGYAFIYFAWHDGTHKARKGLWKAVLGLAKSSIEPIYYTTYQYNLHRNHNKQIAGNLYKLIV